MVLVNLLYIGDIVLIDAQNHLLNKGIKDGELGFLEELKNFCKATSGKQVLFTSNYVLTFIFTIQALMLAVLVVYVKAHYNTVDGVPQLEELRSVSSVHQYKEEYYQN